MTPRNLSSGKIAVSNGRTMSFREWIDQNIAVAVFLAVVLFAATLWMFHKVAGNSTDSPGTVEAAYREVVGRFPPKGFEAGFSGHFVGREVVVLEHSDGLMLYVYFQRWPARRLSPADLDSGVEKVLDFFDMEWTEVRRGTVEQGDEVVMGRILLLGDSQGPHLYLLPIHTADGEPAMLALLGPQVEARAMAREIIERL